MHIADRGPQLRVSARPMAGQQVAFFEGSLCPLKAHLSVQLHDSVKMRAAVCVRLLHNHDNFNFGVRACARAAAS